MKLPLFRTAGALLAFAALSAASFVVADDQPTAKTEADADGWYTIFDGTSLDGWKINENPDSFQVADGKLIVDGPRGHAFYAGDVQNADFKNFELTAEVLTHPKANSGIYFHTKFQGEGWPNTGYEAQVNNTHGDPKKTGGLYAVEDVFEAPAKDGEWFNYYIKVDGKRIVIKIDGKTTVDYTEPDDLNRPERQLSSGTFAIQAHDPESKIEFKNIKVRPLP